MGFLTDVLKEVPLSAVLREKIAAFEAENASLKTENAILKDDLRQAKGEVVKLKEEIQRLTHQDDLDEMSVKILAYLADSDGELIEATDLERITGLHPARVKHLTDNLEKQGYVAGRHSGGGVVSLYNLTPKGREYAVKNNLV
jgi:DNA-binding MarR family transcriptional regulator